MTLIDMSSFDAFGKIVGVVGGIAALIMINYGFKNLSFERIEASTDAPNLASTRVMERAGMNFWKREATNGLDTIYFAI